MNDLFSKTRTLKESVELLDLYIDKFKSLRYTKFQKNLKSLKDEMLEKIEQINKIIGELNDKRNS